MNYQYIILGGSGHVGSALANQLISRGASVLIIGHDAAKKSEWIAKGADYEIADILDSVRLGGLFGLGERLFILNPPAPPSTDTVAVERKQVLSILEALKGAHLQKIVAASTYGAQPGDRIGDLGVLYQLEQALALEPVPVAIIRSAYYMSNWATALKSVQESGILPTLYPAAVKLPMVAPDDIGGFAAELMTDNRTGLFFVEGPERYSPDDVAEAFSRALNKTVKVSTTPEEQWLDALKQTGFSDRAAEYMVNMTHSVLRDKMDVPNPEHGSAILNDYVEKLVAGN